MSRQLLSWNRQPRIAPQAVNVLYDRHAELPHGFSKLIAYGNGRSYGDVCLNAGGTLLLTRRLDRFIAFDSRVGSVTCEAGVLLGDILALVVPRGWFLPVVPGTRFVTVGGAIANDVHGKNHHRAGSFGHHVLRLGLRRSDGTELVCGPSQSPDWFSATVGGLGLTGLITWAEIRLAPVASEWMIARTERFESLEQFWQRSEALDASWPYTVAWIDTLSARRGSVRGLLSCGRHAEAGEAARAWRDRAWRLPVEPPWSIVNPLSLRIFNAIYYRRGIPHRNVALHHVPFLFPLDQVRNWNAIYGRAGFYQYQCVLPRPGARRAVHQLLARIAAAGLGSFLTVLKTFGEDASRGLLSFARPGATLAVDFPNRGARTMALFEDLDRIVLEAGGALYPAKDARMPASVFRAGFAKADEFSAFVDPRFSSSFWRRVMP
jgi:FAD/FMN-containing dehydrogenase